MNDWYEGRYSGLPVGNRRQAAQNLKRCPLCGTLNSRQNDECFTCRWHGAFDDDPFLIEEGLQEMLDQCPELVEAILPAPRTRLSPWQGLHWFWQRMASFFSRPLRARRNRVLDFRV